MRSIPGFLIRLLLGAGIAALVLWLVDLGEVLASLRGLRPGWVAAALGCYAATRVLMAAKWWVLLGGREAPVGFPTVQRALCLADLYGMMLASSVAIDGFRAVLMRHLRGGLAAAAGAILVDRVTNVAVMALLVLAGIGLLHLLRPGAPLAVPVLLAAGGAALAMLAACAAVASRRVMELALAVARTLGGLVLPAPLLEKILGTVRQVHGTMSGIFTSSATVLKAMALGAAVVLARIGVVAALFAAVGQPQPLVLVMALEPIVSVLGDLPISPMGIGVREGAFVFLFGGAGVPASAAVAVSLATYGVLIGGTVLLGLVASVAGPALPRPPADAELPGSAGARGKTP
ncbi:lysylphosphatidylglycerol synthase transmembrane domain-containing protein [Geminicoccaceae bacterium 1502E]|nr:lysylphosphatidylglycerol synthase transmembrane domain-containing protein [Geminicoccaceae bacterium 1502E]